MQKLTIAIDGPAGSGKSSVARRVAAMLGYLYLDSGAMYRALALKALRRQVALDNESRLAELAKETHIELKPPNAEQEAAGAKNCVFLDGADVTQEIRTGEVAQAASRLATIARVRQVLVAEQQRGGAASTSGESLRSRSRLSRSITSSKTSGSVSRSPFSWCSFQRRSARSSGEASRKIFSSALGKTTVPMSRPSITTPPPAPARCCSATSTSRTLAIVASRDAACATSPVRISCVTSAPSRNTQFFAPAASCSALGGFSSMCVSFASSARRDSLSSAT